MTPASHYVVIYNKSNNQVATIDLANTTFKPFGSSTFTPMGGALPDVSALHSVQVDHSGRYVSIYYADSLGSNVYVDDQTGTWANDPSCHRVTGFGNVVRTLRRSGRKQRQVLHC